MDFRDVLSEIRSSSHQEKTILMGNGFTLAGGYRSFDYPFIMEQIINNNLLPHRLHNFMKKKFSNSNEHHDIESCLKNLKQISYAIDFLIDTNYVQDTHCFKQYCQENLLQFQQQVLSDFNLLKKTAITTLITIHPDKYEENEKLSACAENLAFFDKIYTTNYDLLTYWLILKN